MGCLSDRGDTVARLQKQTWPVSVIWLLKGLAFGTRTSHRECDLAPSLMEEGKLRMHPSIKAGQDHYSERLWRGAFLEAIQLFLDMKSPHVSTHCLTKIFLCPLQASLFLQCCCSQSSHFPWRGASGCATHRQRAEAQLPHSVRYSTIGESDEHGGTRRKRAIEQWMSGRRSWTSQQGCATSF